MAPTLDGGSVSTISGNCDYTSSEDRNLLSMIRSEHDLCIVGGNTLRNDDPAYKLKPEMVKYRKGLGKQVRLNSLCVSQSLDVPINGNWINSQTVNRYIAYFLPIDNYQLEILEEKATLIQLKNKSDWPVELLKILNKKYQFNSFLLEGGGILNAAFLRNKLVNELYLTISPIIFGGHNKIDWLANKYIPDNFSCNLNLLNCRQSQTSSEVFLHYQVVS